MDHEEAINLYAEVERLVGLDSDWRKANAALIITVAKDAIHAFGSTEAQKRVWLQSIIDEHLVHLPAKNWSDQLKRAEQCIFQRLPGRKALATIAIAIFAFSTFWSFAGTSIGSFANSFNEWYYSNHRSEILIWRLQSPQEESLPPDVISQSARSLTNDMGVSFTVKSIPFRDRIAEFKQAKENGTLPELVVFTNYGVMEGNGETGLADYLGAENLIEVIGPIASEIVERGWVSLLRDSLNADRVRELLLQQSGCPESPKVSEQVDGALETLLISKRAESKHVSLCSVSRAGKIAIVGGTEFIDSERQIGVEQFVAVVEFILDEPSILTITNDPVSTRLLDPNYVITTETAGADFGSISPQQALARLNGNRATGATPPVLLTSGEVIVIEDDVWNSFRWRTPEVEHVAFQIVIFSFDGSDDRVFFTQASEEGFLPAGLLWGDGGVWRVVNVRRDGRMLSSENQSYWSVWR